MRLQRQVWSCETPVATNIYLLANARLNQGKFNDRPFLTFLFYSWNVIQM